MKNFANSFDTKLKYQKYSHYLLPIAINPLNYGKLIELLDNKCIIQLPTSNVLVIKTIDNNNFIRFYRRGELAIEFIDSKINENIFTRTILDQKFTFENNKLISSEILIGQKSIKIYGNIIKENITPINTNKLITYLENTYIFKIYQAELFILFKLSLIFLLGCFIILTTPEENMALAAFSIKNIIKLRKVTSKYKWKEYVIDMKNKIFAKTLFESRFNNFWKEIENNFIDELILDNVDMAIKKIQVDNPTWNKQQLIEKLIQDNSDHKDKILSIVNRTMEEQIEIWKDKLSPDKFERAMKQLAKEDLKEMQSLSENRSIDKIKTLRSVNRSHNNLLESIKNRTNKSDNPNLSSTNSPDSIESLDKIASEASLFD